MTAINKIDSSRSFSDIIQVSYETFVKVQQEIKCYFCILGDIFSNTGFCPEKLEKFNESDMFQVSEIFPGFLSVFWYSCF